MPATATQPAVLALPLHAEHDGLIVALRSWPAEVGNSWTVADAIATGDYGTVQRALGVPESVTLTADGRGAVPGAWCLCPQELEPVRYERWTAAGRVSHGYLCPKVACRRLVQSG